MLQVQEVGPGDRGAAGHAEVHGERCHIELETRRNHHGPASERPTAQAEGEAPPDAGENSAGELSALRQSSRLRVSDALRGRRELQDRPPGAP